MSEPITISQAGGRKIAGKGSLYISSASLYLVSLNPYSPFKAKISSIIKKIILSLNKQNLSVSQEK